MFAAMRSFLDYCIVASQMSMNLFDSYVHHALSTDLLIVRPNGLRSRFYTLPPWDSSLEPKECKAIVANPRPWLCGRRAALFRGGATREEMKLESNQHHTLFLRTVARPVVPVSATTRRTSFATTNFTLPPPSPTAPATAGSGLVPTLLILGSASASS